MQDLDAERLVGKVGFVTTRIPGSGVAGEVQIPLRGGSETFIARASSPIERGAQVVVVDRHPGRVVDVTLFEAP